MATATKKASKNSLQPLGERIVIQREERESTTAGGIVLPDSAQEKPARGTVIAIGTGKQLDDGSRAPSQLKRRRPGFVQQLRWRDHRDRQRRIFADA